eukprot:TRINITY_DN32835_c0_g1_i2.p1 TRINITY_DN32835_c0_g1~~TRINITY_DN32835_c0_g1_i2.p1  ORF type:complete len:434 (-),score=63.08 TRINITY_DN32835_c0_g1_i2:89-1390(-)
MGEYSAVSGDEAGMINAHETGSEFDQVSGRGMIFFCSDPICFDSPDLVINVGGQEFSTSQSTVSSSYAKGSVFEQCSGRASIFFDRDPRHFRTVLSFLRDGWCALPQSEHALPQLREIWREAEFYRLAGLREFVSKTFPMQDFFASLVAIDGIRGDLRADTAYTLAAIRHTASESEMDYARQLELEQQITLKFCETDGKDLAEVVVNVRSFILDGLVEALRKKANFFKELEKLIDRDACGDDSHVSPHRARLLLGSLDILTAEGNILTDDWSSMSTFELLGIKDGDRLIVKAKGWETQQEITICPKCCNRYMSDSAYCRKCGVKRPVPKGAKRTPDWRAYSLAARSFPHVGGLPPPPPLCLHSKNTLCTDESGLIRGSVYSSAPLLSAESCFIATRGPGGRATLSRVHPHESRGTEKSDSQGAEKKSSMCVIA